MIYKKNEKKDSETEKWWKHVTIKTLFVAVLEHF